MTTVIVFYSLFMTVVTMVLLILAEKVMGKCNKRPVATVVASLIGVILCVCLIAIASSSLVMYRAARAAELIAWLR